MKFSQLGWDVHSHLVPGVDDGAPDVDAALEMVRHMVALGYRGMVLTPHIMSDLYPNSPGTLRGPFDDLVQAVKEAGIPMELRLAAEYLMDADMLRTLKEGDPMTFSCDDGQRAHEVMLMEFGFHHAPEEALVKDALFEAQTRGITPLLAHCERYPYLHKDAALLELWHERGGWMAVNAASLGGSLRPGDPGHGHVDAWNEDGFPSCAQMHTACVTCAPSNRWGIPVPWRAGWRLGTACTAAWVVTGTSRNME